MTLISIRERDGGGEYFDATVSFDGGPEHRITIKDPFSPEEEKLLEWYFEDHLRFPFLKQVDARKAAASILPYGEFLFRQVFADPDAYASYKQGLLAGVETLRFEIGGSPNFHRLHWEALKDPKLPEALSLQAVMLRKNLVPQPLPARTRPSPTINLLVVTARPSGAKDVGYRTISRPLVEGLRQATLPMKVEILRPGTYPALVRHLEESKDRYGSGHYHAIHFDMHGVLLSYDQFEKEPEADRFFFQDRYGRDDLRPYAGLKAFLSMQSPKDGLRDLVEAGELANLLQLHQVPLVILSACQSGKQVGASETSLGSRLMQAGVQMVLAMGYSVTVSAADQMMRTLYQELFAGRELTTAIRRARQELQRQKGRRAYFNQTVDLEDWLLPVVYQNRELKLKVRALTPAEQTARYESQEYRPPAPTYGFVGRDLDILEIEKRLLSARNLLLVRGMGGSGKTTLLHHLGWWWQTTRFIGKVFYFGYDQRAWTCQQLLTAIAEELLGQEEARRRFQPLSQKAQQRMLAELLRSVRHLLILDNLESITGIHLAIGTTLPSEEQTALRDLLAELAGGKSLVLLGSRGGEAWLAKGTFAESVYELPGLDPEAASTLCDRILVRHGAERHRQDPALQKLLKVLAGYPLSLEVVLANLARQAPQAVLAALQAGDVDMDKKGAEEKTESVLRCIDYSHGNLSAEAQGLLLCLAPFTSVIFESLLPNYSEQLRRQPDVAHLPFERWPEVLNEAANWGLVAPHQVPGFLELQPVFPYFLRTRLYAPEQAAARHAIEVAFREVYGGFGGWIANLFTSKDAQEKQLARILARLEYENLSTALDLALNAQVSILGLYIPLAFYLDALQDQKRGLALADRALGHLEKYLAVKLTDSYSVEFISVLDNLAHRQLELKQFAEAEASYQKALSLLTGLFSMKQKDKTRRSASIYHQLGMVAEQQRQWDKAEKYYQMSLQIKIEFNERSSQAGTYHQLGIVAQEQRQWNKAKQYYQKALQITEIGSNDLHAQAGTYHQLGVVAQEQRQWDKAEPYLQKALQIYLDFDDRPNQAGVYHQLGIVAQEQHQWEKAEQYFQNALRIYIDFDDLRYEHARTYHQLGRMAEEQQQWSQAEQYYQKALKINNTQIGIDFDGRYEQARTYHQLGRMAVKQQQWPAARQYYLQALEIVNRANDSHHVAITLHSLAILWQASQDHGLLAAIALILGITLEQVEERLRAAQPHPK